jgi:diguanylate cyclase (GGDEF)-like protein/PAS domain S-box-containing protein
VNFDDNAYHRILENMHEGLYLVDRDRNITFWNKAAEEISGFSADEIIGRSCGDNILTHVDEKGNSLCLGLCPLARSMEDGGPREAEVFLHHKNGHRVPVSVRVNPILDESGTIIGGVELFTDISSREATELRIRELERLALLDNLTQLANRHYIDREIFSRFEEYHRNGIQFGIIFLDIDHFKQFNDDYGHPTGDKVIRYVADTLLYNARPFDIFGRWGGEEFIGIIRNIGADQLAVMAERIRTLIAESYIVEGDEKLSVSVSIGATMAAEADNPDRLLQRADELMYRSKEAGRNRVTSG